MKRAALSVAAALGLALVLLPAPAQETPPAAQAAPPAAAPAELSPSDLAMKAASAGCVSCHRGIEDAHEAKTVKVGCTGCHGGNATAMAPAGAAKGTPAYDKAKNAAHVLPRDRKTFAGSANPQRSYASWLKESPEFVRFVNPSDLRVVSLSCGTSKCHPKESVGTSHSIMRHGA